MGGGRHHRNTPQLGERRKGGAEMKTLYHGSHVAVPEPLARAGRKNLDFGRGFYLTSIEEQAKAWAIIIAGRKGRNVNPVLNIYTFDSCVTRK